MLNLILFLLLLGLKDSSTGEPEPPTLTGTGSMEDSSSSSSNPIPPPNPDIPSSEKDSLSMWAQMDSIYMLKPCNKSREILTARRGRISDGPHNYTENTFCEWLIKAPPGYWIDLRINRVVTECSYDYLFVIDGLSYAHGTSQLLASFSGASNPHVNLLAKSGNVMPPYNMLILLYSDPNYTLSGFEAEYSISPCPLNCSNAGECVQIQNSKGVCKCAPLRGGVACEQKYTSSNGTSSLVIEEELSNGSDDDEDETRLVLASSWNSPLSRVGHSMIHLNDTLFIFGGFDLNVVLRNLVTLDVHTGVIKQIFSGNGSNPEEEEKRKSEGISYVWPSGRYAHAAEQFKNGFFVHGGKIENGSISGELFYYNATHNGWTEYSLLLPLPKLMYHSMTSTPSGFYIFGGATPEGQFSSVLYKFHGDYPTNWTIVKSLCCGKDAARSILGHSMTYWAAKHALLLFGGVGSSDYGRFSKLSSQIWIFMINSSTWLHLDYRKNSGIPPGIHPERAFHSAHVVDKYLTIFGGYTHVHNKDESCYSNQMLVFQLDCQIFLPLEPSSSSSSSESKRTLGIFGHRSIIFKDELLVVVGGYRGSISQSWRRIPFPFTSKGGGCVFFETRWRCSSDPNCGWCPTNSKCFEKLTGAANCTTNLQTTQCPGICPLLANCQACVLPGQGCVWCGTLEQCQPEVAVGGGRTSVCNNPLDNSSQTSTVQCLERNWRLGVTQFEYRFPPNFTHPDAVKVINSSVLIIPKEYPAGSGIPSEATFALRGSLAGISHPIKKLELCALQAAVNLSLISDEVYNSSYRWTDYQLCYNLTWPSSGNPVYLYPGQRIRFELIATSFGKGLNQEKSGRVTIQLKYYSGPISSPRILRKDHLIPFESDYDSQFHRRRHHCLGYRSCLACAGDMACLWRQDTHHCIPRTIPLPSSSVLNSLSPKEEALIYNPALPLIFNKSSLIIQPEDCPLCSDFNFCEDCVSHKFGLECEWWAEEMSCQRRGRLEVGIRVKEECHSPCTRNNNCSSCMDAGKCVWCASPWTDHGKSCFPFSLYTSVYGQYGQCFQWIDKAESCHRCDSQVTCESCILNQGCGWSFNQNGGSCSEGDFGGPGLIQDVGGGGNRTWTYAECPDINECELEIDDCHPNATCVNTPGSFVCFCDQGFTGDGRTHCEQTCQEPCVHGICSALFICECDLGWTGSSCDLDCLCNNHSFCSEHGPGTCDLCSDFTTGQHCELCSEGSYGNATVECKPCSCNGHAKANGQGSGLCDQITGHCFCLNNTTGRDCSVCASGFYGDPTGSKPCYHSCSGRGLVVGRSGFFGLPPELGSSFISARKRQQMQQRNTSFVHVEHCMWILMGEEDTSPHRISSSSSESEDEQEDEDTSTFQQEESLKPKSAGLLITIEPGFDIPCSQNVLLVYKGYSEYGVNGKSVPLIAAICNEKEDRARRTGTGGNLLPTFILVEGNVATIVFKFARMGSTKFSFNGSFKVLNELEMEREANGGGGSSPFSRISSQGMLPFNVSSLYDGTSPSLSVLSRYGHTLHVDRNNLWIFGGRSLGNGPLNDIRHFNRESNAWLPLTITVQQNEEAVPPARYFHGGVIVSGGVIVIHGGISANLTFLEDTWKFDTTLSRWHRECQNESPKLAGHTLTLRPGASGTSESMGGGGGDLFTIVMIGGFTPEEGFSDKVYSIGLRECWVEIETTGSHPLGVYGHSTVYHEKTDTFYVFGGTLHHDTIGLQHVSISASAKLFALHWPSKRWSVLSPIEDNQMGPYPSPRFLHSAIGTEDYMVILGGIGSDSRHNTGLVYVYQCNLWLLVGPEESFPKTNSLLNISSTSGDEGAQITSRITGVASATTVWHNEIFQMGGWNDGQTSESLLLLSIPKDPCSLQKTKSRCKGTLGCAYCSSNNNQTQQCYKAEKDLPSTCSLGASNIEFWKGIPCTSTWLTQQGCSRFNSCTECLAKWPSHPNMTQSCQWCTNGKEGRCISKKFDEDSPCGQKQWVITDSTQCPERQCSSPECLKCMKMDTGKCIWTRQILRSRERAWELRLQPVYDWNCVRKSILDTSPNLPVSSSPPNSCPIPCHSFVSCQECLESPGAEGGFHSCYWSVNINACLSPAYSPLLCFGGICGPILKGPPTICPKPCTTLMSCNACLENPSCGWCELEGENGQGICLPANTVSETAQCAARSKWNYLKCPKENECSNGHHACDPSSESCIDLEEGYRCQCRDGFERSDTSCIPICLEGCVHGTCVEPEKCSCNFGYIGSNCSAQCDCNGHSDCLSVDKLDTCLDCKNNTMGHKCSLCKPLSVGDPRNNGVCVACNEYCNGHSNICVSQENYHKWCAPGGANNHLSSSELMSKILSGIQVGPSTTAFCCRCQNETSGDTCNDCIPGFFRGYDDKRLSCRQCECQGHGHTCDQVTGNDCNCQNNTESEHCTQNTLKQNLHHQCWKHQCSKCKESYLGTPTNGHQCYIQMLMEEFYCFDPKSQDQSCVMKQKPLLSGRTTFFAIQPKFMNVNIRATVDVTHGSVNIYLSPKDDTFVIKQDDRWVHRVDFDTKYGLSGDRRDSIFGGGKTTSTTPFSGEQNNKIDVDYDISPNKSNEVENSGVNRIIPKQPGGSANPNSAFRFIEQEAAGYATYYTVQDPKAILLVRNLRNRLVITLPQDSHDLRLTRFYIVLEGIGDVSFGSIVFRQDQLHIDLFIFFSVFFSAFFLFLAGCGIAWKVKQNMETRRARHRHVAEMLSMAKRPFAMCTALLQPEPSSGIAEAYTQCRKSCRKGCICLRPLAVEWLAGTNTSNAVCTMLISMPGGGNTPVKMGVGSVLANLQRSHAPYHTRRRRLQH